MNDVGVVDNKKADMIVVAVSMALLAVMIALDICYMFLGGTPLKSVTSLMFVAVGVVGMIYAIRMKADGKYKYVLPAALTVAMIGDIVINVNFIAGAAVFALGHVVYVAAYFVKNGFRIADLIIGACIFVPSALIITLVPYFDFGGVALEAVCVVYAFILSAMTGKAISDCAKRVSVFSVVVAVGSILFFISDLALLINQFAMLGYGGRLAMRILCLGTYYPAQFLLAFSVYIFARRAFTATEQKCEPVD